MTSYTPTRHLPIGSQIHALHSIASQIQTSTLEPRRSPMSYNARNPLSSGLLLASLCLTLAGCALGVSSSTPSAPVSPSGSALKGSVYGGQNPITGARVYLYAAGNTGYGSAYTYKKGTSLLGTTVVTTGANGVFNITGDYTCPSATTPVYIEAVGGVATGTFSNTGIIMLAALGPCGNLSSTSFITMNELTTVASVWALAPFMTGPTNIGSSAANQIGLANAFATVNKLVSIQYGQVNTTSVPAGATLPTNELNTLADIIAACVNMAKTGTACGNLYTYATPPSGTKPTSTLQAALNMAHYPAQNVPDLAALATKTSPFEPILGGAPNDWTLSVRYTGAGNISAPTAIAADQAGNIWITNTNTTSVTRLDSTGAFTANYVGGDGPIAIDLTGNAWTNSVSTPNSLEEITSTGVITSYTGAGLISANSIAIDGSGDVWAAGSGVLSEFNSSGTPLSTSGYTGGGLTGGASIAITSH
jgi:hypothetical protein